MRQWNVRAQVYCLELVAWNKTFGYEVAVDHPVGQSYSDRLRFLPPRHILPATSSSFAAQATSSPTVLSQRCQGQEHLDGSGCYQALTACTESILEAAALNRMGNTNTPLHAIVIQRRKEGEIKPERIERLLSSLNQTTETSENRNCQSSENRRHVARMGKSRYAYRVLVGRPEGKRPLGRPRCRREDNIKMDLREVGYDDRDWINLAHDRDQWRAYVRTAMNLRVPYSQCSGAHGYG
ncbi:hypothetical protein ANN_22049 [Periplaneta americana]|uniref:Uncharacterized protein n=1 Tax=Periplaneta americana TaxID=6978 RepID=A0ABQ8S7L3_PERAM|nr:hypothetical protein ANN_22049 [Periplaneta americana]